MGISENVLRLMNRRGISRYRLAKLTKVPYTTLIKILDGTTKNPQIESLAAIAEVFNVSVDTLTGNSVGSLIEERLKTSGMTIEEVADKANVTVDFLVNIDQHTPKPGDYEAIDRIAKVLYISSQVLRAAFARQEPPAYDGPQISVEEAFGDVEFKNPLKYKSPSPKEERDIATDLQRMISELESKEALAFHGEPMDDETKELMKISLENSLRLAKGMAKQKFNPNKNK